MEVSAPHPVIEGPSPESLSEVLSVARAAVDQEFSIAERLDAKARSLVTISAQWFAVSQAVAAVAFSAHKPHDWMLWTVGGTAVVGACALSTLFILCSDVWKIRDEEAVSPRGLLQMLDTALTESAVTKFVQHYASLLQDRRKTNKSRSEALDRAQIAWFVAMAVPLLELGFALATRLFA